MENKNILEFIINLLGLGILIWFFSIALADMIKGNHQKSALHNTLIIAICLIYSLKILLKDLLGVV